MEGTRIQIWVNNHKEFDQFIGDGLVFEVKVKRG